MLQGSAQEPTNLNVHGLGAFAETKKRNKGKQGIDVIITTSKACTDCKSYETKNKYLIMSRMMHIDVGCCKKDASR